MDCRAVIIICLVVFMGLLVANVEGRSKKVVIHVPYKVKQIKHTHTVFKTVHHHHTHHDNMDHGPSPSEEHEHFHHFHMHEQPQIAKHSQPISGISIPEFLPDTPLEIEDLPAIALRNELSRVPGRHFIPPYKRQFIVKP